MDVFTEREGMHIDISAIAADFPEFRVAVLICEDLAIAPVRSTALDAFIAEVEAETRERWRGTELSAIPGIAAWRQAYRQFGIKKTSYRSSVERLVKNVLAGAALPAINGFVDAYNAVSLAHVLPAGADDLDHVRGDLAFRYSRRATTFRDMGALGRGRRAARRSAQAGRGGLRRRGKGALPPLELAAGCALGDPRGDTPRRRDAAGERRRRSGGSGSRAGGALSSECGEPVLPSPWLDAANPSDDARSCLIRADARNRALDEPA